MHTAHRCGQPLPPLALAWEIPARWSRSRLALAPAPVDALTLFLRWRDAVELGHKTAAAAALDDLRRLAVRRPKSREMSLTAGNTENTEKII
jgi:hypothetical protein